jgi:hypothetical protein
MKSVSKSTSHQVKPSNPYYISNVGLILMLILLSIDVYVLYSTYTFKQNKESCPCAITSNTDKIILTVSIIVCVSLISTVLIPLITYLLNIDRHKLVIIPGLIGFITYFVGIYYSYLLIKYTNELKNNKCECVSENFKYYIHNYGLFRIIFALFPFAILLLVIIFFLLGRLFS